MIVTFYSYKGGVGRSMAIANIATLMARDYQKTVLVVDWDLESPGLHRFFNLKDSDLKGGVIDIIYDYKKLLLSDNKISEKELPNITQRDGEGSYEYIIPLKVEKGSLFIMPAGRLDKEYAMKVNLFDWKNFYDEWEGGGFIENLKQQFREFADYTLVDSRTGITDIGGICTRQLPDTIVLMLASNWQNLDGIKKIAEKVRVDFEDKKINLLPVFSRVESFLEHDKYEIWKNLFLNELGQYIPKNVNRVEYIEHLTIPYIGRFSFDEYPIAVNLESGTDPKQISFAYKYLLMRIVGKEEKVVIPPDLHNQTPPESNFVGRREMLKTMTEWYNDPDVSIGALIGWGGVGKSALARKWYDSLEENEIRPDGIFWWGFYRNVNLEQFLNALLRYVSQGEVDPDAIKSTWEKTEKIKEYVQRRAYLIILDGLEQIQKGDETGEGFGCMVHRECTEILTFLLDTKAKGLCLITTRYPLTDIRNYEGTAYQNREVDRLELEDARALFEKVVVKGEQKDKDKVIEEYKGHALSLILLSNYLVQNFEGNIEKAKQMPPFHSDKQAGGKAHRILLWYDSQLTPEQRSFMKIFSLFRTAVREEDFKGVFCAKMKTKMNQTLRSMSDFSFRRMRDNLCDRRLISKGQDNTYATHPLIKNYFESIFEEEDKRLCHKHIYQFIDSFAPNRPKTLEEMQPLFEQVYHGCSAGLYDEVYNDVYWEKINRKEYFLTHKLGAWETDPSLIRNFFPKGEFLQLPLVSMKCDQSSLLNEAGLSLLSTGRPKEAAEIFQKKLEMDVRARQWEAASVGYQNLSDLQFRIGEIKKGLESAKTALEFAEKAGRDDDIICSKAYLAHIFHLWGKGEEAEKWFKEADELERKSSGYRLHSLRGLFYADFLISIKRIDEAFELTRQNLKICEKNNFVNSISICHRCLAAIKRIKGNYQEAEGHLQKALEPSRKVGMPELEIGALLEYGRLYLERSEYKDALNAGDEVLKICERTGFLLYEPDAEVILAKAYLAQKDFDQAKTFANSALSKSQKMSYKLAENDALNLLKEILA